MDFSKFDEELKVEQTKFNEIRDTKDAAKFDEICINVNDIFGKIVTVIPYTSSESRKPLVPILHNISGFSHELSDYKKTFGEVEQQVVVDEEVPPTPVQDTTVPVHETPTPVQEFTPERVPTEPMYTHPVQEDPVEISIDEGPSEQSPSESQSKEMGNVKTLTLSNPNVPKHSNPFIQPNAA